MKTRNGKVAACPLVIRDELNRRLLEGDGGVQLLKWLNAQPEVQRVLAARFDGVPITKDNLTAWRDGGFTEWFERREKLEHVQSFAEYAKEMGKAAGGGLMDGCGTILGGKILDLLAKPELEAKELAEVAKALATLQKAELEVRKAQQRDRLLDLRAQQTAQRDRLVAVRERWVAVQERLVALKEEEWRVYQEPEPEPQYPTREDWANLRAAMYGPPPAHEIEAKKRWEEELARRDEINRAFAAKGVVGCGDAAVAESPQTRAAGRAPEAAK